MMGVLSGKLLAQADSDDAHARDLHEAVTTLEDTERTARRVLGGAHPIGVHRRLRMPA